MGILRRIFGRQPGQTGLAREMAAAAVEAAADRIRGQGQTVTSTVVNQATQQVANALERNPVTANNLGLERGTESRTGMAAIGAIATGLGTLLVSVGGIISQAETLSGFAKTAYYITAIFGGGTTGAGLFGVIGRFRDDLPPMFRRWWNPLSWLARPRDEVLANPVAPPQ